MSYDITAFNVKGLVDFNNKNLYIDDEKLDELDVEICGFKRDDKDNFISIEYGGEGSGRSYDKFINLLKDSVGYLEAIVVWEGGDRIVRIKIDNGIYTEEEI